MRLIGPESNTESALRKWFDEQPKHNLNRLEDGAKVIIQLVTALYGILFGVLALSSQPIYLAQLSVQWFGGIAVLAFFIATVSSLVTLYPWRVAYQEDNLSDMERGERRILRRKLLGLQIAFSTFIIGMACLGGLIFVILLGI